MLPQYTTTGVTQRATAANRLLGQTFTANRRNDREDPSFPRRRRSRRSVPLSIKWKRGLLHWRRDPLSFLRKNLPYLLALLFLVVFLCFPFTTSTGSKTRVAQTVRKHVQEHIKKNVQKHLPKAQDLFQKHVQKHLPKAQNIFPKKVTHPHVTPLVVIQSAQILSPALPIPTIEGFTLPRRLSIEGNAESQLFDFGELQMDIFQDGGVRQIKHDFDMDENSFRPRDASLDDDMDGYFAYDDDYLRGQYTANRGEEGGEDKICRRVSEHRLNFQNCNVMHELPLLESAVKYLSEGAYRQVMKLSHDYGMVFEKVVIKDIHYSFDVDYENFEYVRNDALVAERLTASPRIFDVYGMCGLGILSEYFLHGDIESVILSNEETIPIETVLHPPKLRSYNKLKPTEKLVIATQMAEALTDLHGNKGGVIVHQDIQLAQYLYNEDKSILKLNDFNRAEFMLWDEQAQEYCGYRENPGNGNWRSAEEYYDYKLNEKVDVFSLGNNLYSILTGLEPHFDTEDLDELKHRVKHGKAVFIDERYKSEGSIAESRLVDAIKMCHQYKADDRPSAYDLATFLRAAQKEMKDAGERDVV